MNCLETNYEWDSEMDADYDVEHFLKWIYKD